MNQLNIAHPGDRATWMSVAEFDAFVDANSETLRRYTEILFSIARPCWEQGVTIYACGCCQSPIVGKGDVSFRYCRIEEDGAEGDVSVGDGDGLTFTLRICKNGDARVTC